MCKLMYLTVVFAFLLRTLQALEIKTKITVMSVPFSFNVDAFVIKPLFLPVA